MPASLNSEAIANLLPYGNLIFNAPLEIKSVKLGADSGINFSLMPRRRWFVDFALDLTKSKSMAASKAIEVFETLRKEAGWPISVKEVNGKPDVAAADASEDTFVDLMDTGKGRYSLTLEETSESWQRGLQWFRGSQRCFGAEAWDWGYDLTPWPLRREEVDSEVFWPALQSLGLPDGQGMVSLSSAVNDLEELGGLCASLRFDERIEMDFVDIEIAPQYGAKINLITKAEGHFVEAALSGGWGDEERSALERLLEARLVDA